MVSFLKKLSDVTPVTSPTYLLHQHLSGMKPGRTLANVHASELTKPDGLCPRLYALADQTGLKLPDQWSSTSDEMLFRQGRDMQKSIVEWFAEMGKAIGHWKCLSCSLVQQFVKRPVACSCGCLAFEPEEVRFTSKKSGATCGVDCMIDVGAPRLLPLEIKTMKSEDWKKLVAPLGEHRERSNLYLRIIDEDPHVWSESIDTSQIVVLYVDKGGFGILDDRLKQWGFSERFSPFKEYIVKRHPGAVEHLMHRAKVVKDFREGKVGMPVGLCGTALEKRAQYCVCKKPCWSGDFPAEHDWRKDAPPT